MHQLRGPPAQVEEFGPDLRPRRRFRQQHPNDEIEIGVVVMGQVRRRIQPLTEDRHQPERQLVLAEDGRGFLQGQGQPFAFEQQDGAVAQVALQRLGESVQQGDAVGVGLQGAEAVEQPGVALGVAAGAVQRRPDALRPADRLEGGLGALRTSGSASASRRNTSGAAAGSAFSRNNFSRSINSAFPPESASASASARAAAAPALRQRSRSAATAGATLSVASFGVER